MSRITPDIIVRVKYAEVEQTFAGNVEDVWISVNKFFSEMVPAFDLTCKIMLNIDLAKLIEDIIDVIAIAPEGPELLVPKARLTDREALQLHLLAAFIGAKLGKFARETLTKEELSTRLGKNVKTVATRLGELVKDGIVSKTEDGSYRIMTIGVKRLQDEILPRIRTRL